MAGRRGADFLPQSANMLLLLFTFYFALCSAASEYYIAEQMIDSAEVSSPLDSGMLLVDLRPAPVPPNPKSWTLATEAEALQRRGLEGENNNNRDESTSSTSSKTSMASSETSTAPKAHKTTASETHSSTSTSSSSLATQSSKPSPKALPMPFDQGFTGNITDSCSSFVNGFLADPTFKSCLPFSLLLQTSQAFFQACKSVLTISQTLDATCGANVDTCTDYMNILSSNLTTACASDLSAQNPSVVQAQFGLEAYNPLYTASCLRNPATSSYCFADAVTNRSSPTDSYIYYIPLNISLPGGSQPTCDTCLVNTMGVLKDATSDRNSPLASYYSDAAQQVNVHCGPTFVNTSLAAASSPSIGGRLTAPGPELALVVLLGALLFGGF